MNKIKAFHDLLVAFMAGYTGDNSLNLNVPKQSGTLAYSGAAQSPKWSDYDSAKLTIGGTTSSTNAGTYTATFTPKTGYKWADGTTSTKNVTWTIAKAEGSVTLSESSGTVFAEKPFTFTVTGNKSGGILSVKSADTSYVTASISGTTVTVNYVKNRAAGTDVTVTSAETANYKEATATIKVISSTTTSELTLSETSGTVTVDGTTTFTVSTPSDGALTVTRSPTTVANAVISGTTVTVTGKTVGECTITVKQAASGNYTAATATFVVTVTKLSLEMPTVTPVSFIYDGEKHAPTIGDYDSTYITVTNNGGTTARTYYVTFHLVNTKQYQWSDGTTDKKKFAWIIEKAILSVPTVTNTTFTYDGNEHSPTVGDYDSTYITVVNTAQTNAGSYLVRFILNGSSYVSRQWSDGTTDQKKFAWIIEKADGEVTLSPSSMIATVGKDFTFIVTSNKSGGTLSVKSSDTSYVTASISGNKVTVNALKFRSTPVTVTVTSAATDNYNAASATATVTIMNV